ncbi:hypothetical protein BGZ98_000607 [Dissophora globulifera]|nr:hypothetical protein BGZ98_000607 [Dissophora globulifera]
MSHRLPLLTIFHNPSNKFSVEALRLLKKASASHLNLFRIQLIQAKTIPPSKEQIVAATTFLGNGNVEDGLSMLLVAEAPPVKTIEEAQEVLKLKPEFLRKPLIIDWARSRAIVADPPQVVKTFVDGAGVPKPPKEPKRSKDSIDSKSLQTPTASKVPKGPKTKIPAPPKAKP